MPKTVALAISEIFGPTLQGEGPSTGVPCRYIRLAGCNLTCHWCDTKYSWDWKNFDKSKEVTMMPVEDILAAVPNDVPLYVISGGEPLLQWSRGLGTLVRALLARRFQYVTLPRVEIETNGTIPPPETSFICLSYNVSPKLANSGDPENKRIIPDSLRAFAKYPRARFKFVVENEQDIETVLGFCTKYEIPRDQLWVMPQAEFLPELDRRMPEIAAFAIKHKVQLSDRLHLRLWKGARGN